MEDRSWTLSDEVYNVFGFFEEALDPNSKRDDLFKQSILATLQQMLQEFGQERREVFLEMIPKVLFYIQATNLEIRTSAMACMTALVRELGETILPYLSKVKDVEDEPFPKMSLLAHAYCVGLDSRFLKR